MTLNWDFMVISSSSKHAIVIFAALILLSNRANCDDSLHANKGNTCLESERRALIAIKSDMYDPGEWLSSWTGYDCCKWRGVACDNVTGFVTSLDLHYPFEYNPRVGISSNPYEYYLWAEIDFYPYDYNPWVVERIGASKVNPSLFELKHLRYLDLSFNNFSYAHVPPMNASLVHLEYLNLSNAFFYGLIPPVLGNLSHIQHLDLGNCYTYPSLFSNNLSWLSNLNSLQYLDMSCVHLSKATNWLHQINLIPTLQVLILRRASLPCVPPSLPTFNLTSLTMLDLSRYEGNISASMLRWLSNASNLEHLDLSECMRVFDVKGLPVALGALHNLRKLVLVHTQLAGEFSTILKNVSRMLQYLDLRWNFLLSGEISTILSILPHQLEFLALHDNNIYGRIPEMLGNYTSLRYLTMSYTRITGDIPRTIGKLIHLEYLDLFGNHITGEMPLSLGNLTNLVFLCLSGNNITGPILESVGNLVSLKILALSENKITGEIPKTLGSLQNMLILDLQGNFLTGQIPTTIGKISNLRYLDVSENHLTGEIPATIDKIFNRIFNLRYLDVSGNHLIGEIPTTIDTIFNLRYLDVSENHLTGEIPTTIDRIFNLRYLDVSENHLTGEIPRTIDRIFNLRYLDVSENHLTGEIPKTFSRLCNLWMLDLSLNNIIGELADLLDGLSNCPQGAALSSLRIADNNLNGIIPSNLGLLAQLEELDLSSNSLQGHFRAMFQDYTNSNPCHDNNLQCAMAPMGSYRPKDKILITAKGSTYEYIRILSLVTSIDLSHNNLSGEIPNELMMLRDLHFLSLSNNHLTGIIPENIAVLTELFSLDLSMNNLTGTIPSNLSALNFLSHLNLSFNNLSGRIPTGNQFLTFDDPAIYAGNKDLCGWPLPECPSDEAQRGPLHARDDDDGNGSKLEKVLDYAFIAMGFIVGFWAYWGAMIMKKSIRIALFQMVDRIYDYVQLAVKFVR
ncbi:probable inactive leucine-rich repeat receptor kinase XIAO [Zingiber officinale]|uniref:probable inactive leucine-rich repeat receptor kinase XIAO n=1 Tax=Zingiber officinale TaxID=94328 RepID=UPI001C4DD69E|nr:probable inactive leucine-rich repeat receptor kinase XIAO [Zingiber officinale]